MNQLDFYLPFDEPIEYKKLKFYPIRVKDYFLFTMYSSALLVDKNSIPDPKVISMGYLEYLFHLTITDIEHTPYMIWLDRLLALTLKDEKSFEDIEESLKRYIQNEKGKTQIVIDGEKYDERDFLEIRNIIAQQNLLELSDENISKEVRDSLEYARDYKARLQGGKGGSFEDYIISLAVETGWTYEYIYNLSIRKFMSSIQRLDNSIHYKIYLAASMSGMVDFKDKSFIIHWLSSLTTKEKYADVSMSLDSVQSTISMDSAKK